MPHLRSGGGTGKLLTEVKDLSVRRFDIFPTDFPTLIPTPMAT